MNINYQQIFEDDISSTLREQTGFESRFFELTNSHRLLVEELIEAGYRRALEDALDPEVLSDTAAMAAEMGTQMYAFANLLESFMGDTVNKDEPPV